MKNKKLGVIVPYRDRFEQLQIFKNYITEYLNSKDIPFELIVVEQDGGSNFNRGKLLNIGFKYAKKLKCDYVVFHDVDMLPIDVDYSYAEHPIHLATNFISDGDMKRTLFDDYFGGVTLFPISDFERINGYSNDYWGWGFEDNDLLYRCKINNILLDKKEVKNIGGQTTALKFNGVDSYVKSKVKFDFNKPITLFVSFCADNPDYNLNTLYDKFTILSIPKLNINLNYNSYKRYNLEINKFYNNFMYINSEITDNYKTNLIIVINTVSSTIKMYQDGILIGEQSDYKVKKRIERDFDLFLGAHEFKNNELITPFKGLINSFAIYNGVLNEKEIVEISNNQYFGLTQNFGDYKSADRLILHYDAKFIKNYKLMDLVFNSDGEINGCEIVGYDFEKSKIIEIPFRRNCTFKLLRHDENGYINNNWKDITTRYNQLKFHNEVERGYIDTTKNGLSNLYYEEHSKVRVKNKTHIIVKI
jgi:hypothetical protein